MKKRYLAVGLILMAAGAAGGFGWYYFHDGMDLSSDEQAVYVSSVSSIVGSKSGVTNRYAGVVEPQKTVEVSIESGRTVKSVNVKTGQEVSQGQLLFEYDLSSIQDDLKQAQLDLDRLKNEAMSLNEQIATLEKEKKQASKDNQLSYTIEIETSKMNLKKNEYDQESKTAEIEKLQNATGNTEVRSEIDGVIQKIDTSKMTTEEGDYLDESSMDTSSSSDGSSNAFITILSTGAYRVKGQINELEAQSLMEGEPMIIRSRIDEDQIWRGTMGTIDRENAVSDSSNSMYYGMMDTGSSQTTSSTYPFYVELDASDGLMLGQHVYIERDNGQEEEKDGLWLSEFYIVDADTPDPYVWAVDDKNKLEKRSVILGNYDEGLCEYEIVDGVTLQDYLAYPSDSLEEGMKTTTSETALLNSEDMNSEDMYSEDMYSEEMYSDDLEAIDESEEEYTEDSYGLPEDGEIIEGDSGEEVLDSEMMEDVFEEDLVPIEENEEEYYSEEEITYDDAEDLE